MELTEVPNQDKLEKVVEEISNIRTTLLQRENLLKKTAEEMLKEYSRLENISKEIPAIIQNFSKEDKESDEIGGTLHSIDISILTLSEEKQRLLDNIKLLQSEEIPHHEAKLKEIEDQIKLSQPELHQRLSILENITLEVATENQRLAELSQQLQSLQQSVPEYYTVHQDMLDEIKSLDNRLRVKTEEKQKILDNIKNLQSEETLQYKVKLNEIKALIELTQSQIHQRKESVERLSQETDTINKRHEGLLIEIKTLKERCQEQINIYERLPKETAALDMVILSKNTEKQRLQEKIHNLENVLLPQEADRIKEVKEQIRPAQAEISDKQGALELLNQEISQGIIRLRELETKEEVLKREYQSAESNRLGISQELARLKETVEQRKIESDKLSTWTSQVDASINQYTELQTKTRETSRLLMDELQRRRETHTAPVPTILSDTEKRISNINISQSENRFVAPQVPLTARKSKPLLSPQQWKALFILTAAFFIVGLFVILLWKLISLLLRTTAIQ
ncbi:MAG: hypothetical protein QME51_03100 [Planctomycetota bacterium]|nr:hypothetical protein [Planctomycetota bacterium]MDI6787341.1 hypothetical protein [Planctomycetota bacterium]